MRILLVEDEDAIADPLSDGLRREGFVVERAATGAQALAAGETDFVLLDLRLPDVDGLDVCRGLRARSDVPIIMVSARGEESTALSVSSSVPTTTSSSRSGSVS